jgi:class 3 adenylate cyclase
MPLQGNPRSKAKRVLERSNKPILFLAGLAVVLYILELFRVIPQEWMGPFLWMNFIIDFIFLIDLGAKSLILGRAYLKSPWFFIDFISTLPIISSSLELAGSLGPQLQATRIARVARVARIARVARLAKVARVARLVTAIRARQGLTFLKSEDNQKTPAFDRALLIAVPVLLAAFILANAYITNEEVNNLKDQLDNQISQVQTQADLETIQEEYPITNAFTQANEIIHIESPLNVDDVIPLSLSKAYTRANRLAGILLLLILLSIGLSVYISSSLSKDRNSGRERSILSQCFSPAIVDKFYASPEVINRYYNHWMTVFFIDIRGFTQATEKDPDDVEGLALKLRRVMDTARREIVDSHEGIVDKFMGDAVMGWVGGHFSTHWDVQGDVREKLCIDELNLINQDIKKIKREISELDSRVNGHEQDLAELESILEDAMKDKSALIDRQENAKKQDPDLQNTHEKQTLIYQQQVAQSAVSCCLRITQEVGKIEDPEGFHKLKIGVGSGQVLVGNFGSTDQIAFTVLGPTVNRSARLEPASAQIGCDILIDRSTYDLLKDGDAFQFRRVPRISVKGISKDIISYEPFFADQVTKIFLDKFEQGVSALEEGNNENAITYFSEADKLRPGGDVASKLWLEFSREAIQKGDTLGTKSINK